MEWWSRPFDVHWWSMLLGSFALSACVTWASIRYAHSRNLIDHPGQRRSHTQPTPRGGGIGIVVAAAIFSVLPLFDIYPHSGAMVSAILCGLLLVAAVGWWDDHFGLAAIVRFAVHLLASCLLAWSVLGNDGVVVVALFTLAAAWSINLHNFMDGINGILAMQGSFVFLVLGALGYRYGQFSYGYALTMWALAVATLGFLPFNFPRARVFMGDVGSGAVGFLIAAGIGLGLDSGLLTPGEALILVSAFMIDASCTLASRMLRGRRWYSAHREHLYQWLARSGFGHAGVVGIYALWNLLVICPALLAYELTDGNEDALCIAVYALGVALWLAGKRYCVQCAKVRRTHATA